MKNIKVYPLFEGKFAVDSNKEFTHYIPGKTTYKGLLVSISPFLLKIENKNILLDSGVGQYENDTLMIQSNLQQYGARRESIDYIALSHLHKDHILGLINNKNDEINFPNAKLLIFEKEFEYHISEKNNFSEFILKLEKKYPIIFLKDRQTVLNSITFYHTGGHSIYHCVIIIEYKKEKVFYGADLLSQGYQGLIRYKAKYDYDPSHALMERTKFVNEAISHNALCLFYHDMNHPIGVYQNSDEGIKFIPKHSF